MFNEARVYLASLVFRGLGKATGPVSNERNLEAGSELGLSKSTPFNGQCPFRFVFRSSP